MEPTPTPNEIANTPQAPVATPVAQPEPQAIEHLVHDVVPVIQYVKQAKPGYKTTEFWLTIAFNVLNSAVLLIPADSQLAKVAGLVVAGGTVLGYSHSRGLAKST